MSACSTGGHGDSQHPDTQPDTHPDTHLNAQLFGHVLGQSPDTLGDLLMIASSQINQDRLRQLLKVAYPLCPGEPDVYSFAESADLTILGTRRWSVVCLLCPDLTADADKSVLTRLLARLRDLHADRVVHIEVNSAESSKPSTRSWSMADSLALGFSRCSNTKNPAIQSQELEIYEFNIRTYKPAPDWLNAKHWANPEMWEKRRW